MRAALIGLSLVGGMLMAGCESGSKRPVSVTPPRAEVRPHRLEKHGDVRIDNYYWLNQREDPEVIAYLNAENAHTAAVMGHTKTLQEELFEEIKGRIKQNDESVPYRDKNYYYYSRFLEGKQYRVHCRRRGALDGPEQIMLDVNDVAAGKPYCSVRGLKVSSSEDILAYGVDTVGRRIYTIKFKNLVTGEEYADTIPDVTGNMAWANDNKTLFYTKQDPITLRSDRIYRHELGTDASRDQLVFKEQDETFSCFVFKTKSRKYIMIASQQTLSSEFRYVDADAPGGPFTVILPRERDHEYSVEHFGEHFYIKTNDQAKNFRLVSAPIASPQREHWVEVVPHRHDVLLEGFEIFKKYMVVSERRKGLMHMRVMAWAGGEHEIDFGEPAYMAFPSSNVEFDTSTLRFVYSSMTTPRTVYDYDMAARTKQMMKQDEVLGGFDASRYETRRLYASARDGTQVPISIVYRKGLKRDGSHPCLLYAYGSYGSSMDASFSSSRLSLLDRGFVYAIAHVRGGEEMGRQWYEDGKLLKKKNTFTDFIDCGSYLVREQYTSAERLYAMGGSAGGLLMGAIINMSPELFDGVVARVPFVDVVTTMLDDSIPLTTSEYDEWGNPNDKTYYDYMLSYSPYDNVTAQHYPHVLVTTGLHDSQVQYWEPAKWVAKLRATKADDNLLLMKTNMEAGHGGASGRYKRYRETAFIYAFLLELAGRS